MLRLEAVGSEWFATEIEGVTDTIIHVSPSSFNEETRYLPSSVTSIPGHIRFKVNPFMREILDCADVNSLVREVNLKKGAQVTFTTLLECILLYFMAHVKILPIMFVSADKEMATERIENNVLPMLAQSGLAHIIRSSDEGNTHKSGKTEKHLQFEGGGYLMPFGAQNANKMRAVSMCVILKDELDGWPLTVGKDGDPDTLTDVRAFGFWKQRKIFRGSTPLIKGVSKIDAAYLRGDQRKYMVLCKACGFPQELRWETLNKETGMVGGFQWEMNGKTLILESVCYCCCECGEPHYEHDKERLFAEEHGAHWQPTAEPVEPGIRSYHLPGFYSPIGMQPWSKCVSLYLECYDPEARKVIDMNKYQVFYNTVLGMSFEIQGSKIRFTQVSAHRRTCYTLGHIPNEHAKKFAGSPVLFLTCTVDVHKSNLAVAIIGWTKDARNYLIDYWRFEVDGDEDDCSELTSPVWARLREVIDFKEYVADDGRMYKIPLTFVDAGYAHDTVVNFCKEWDSGVYPILGRDRPAKAQAIIEFAEFKTQLGTVGYRILVDHYKDRLGPVLRREWLEENGEQSAFHFNAPIDTPDAALKELTVETRREKIDERGGVTYHWHRPGNARNELWDLLCYAHAAVEVLAWAICIQHFQVETIDWEHFWRYLEEQELYYS